MNHESQLEAIEKGRREAEDIAMQFEDPIARQTAMDCIRGFHDYLIKVANRPIPPHGNKEAA